VSYELNEYINKRFSARQHITLYAIARPSVRPSHGWISRSWSYDYV